MEGEPSPLMQYFGVITNQGKLNQLESLVLCKYALIHGKKHVLEMWLKEDKLECSEVLGKYCEKIDLNLACMAYERANCDRELINVCNRNGLFDRLARYLVKRQDMELWEQVLNVKNQYRLPLIDKVVHSALADTTNPEAISSTMEAFLSANLSKELIELLEKFVLVSDHR